MLFTDKPLPMKIAKFGILSQKIINLFSREMTRRLCPVTFILSLKYDGKVFMKYIPWKRVYHERQ